jgi:hypothetical protein
MSTSILTEVLSLKIFHLPDLVEYRIYAELFYNFAMFCAFNIGMGLFYTG